jgi:hypothetical protein
VLFPVDGPNACEKIHPAQFDFATRHGKFFCSDRDPSWFLDIGLGQCWSCPPGSIRNANPVNGDAGCSMPLSFGDVRSNPNASYTRPASVQASFWAGHPGNVFGTFDDGLTNGVPSFLKVQRRVGGQWRTVRTDADWDTTFEWEEANFSGAATIKWVVPANAETGTYRITHQGYHGDLFGVTPYNGTSREFQVE